MVRHEVSRILFGYSVTTGHLNCFQSFIIMISNATNAFAYFMLLPELLCQNIQHHYSLWYFIIKLLSKELC